MDLREISSADLIDDGDRWTKPKLLVQNVDGGFLYYLTNEMQTFHSKDETVEVPIFWADEGREKTMDSVWSRYPGSVKFVVKDGRRKGYVGFVRVN